MARGKKEKMSLDELFKQALLKEEEQPYEVPSNWVWTKLDNIVSICTGKKDANYGSQDGMYHFFTCAAEPIKCEGYSFEGESILLAGNGANVGLALFYDGKFEAYQRTYVIQSNSSMNLRYVYYHFKGFWKEYNADKQYGSSTNYIKLGNFQQYPIPLPPLAEQQRIVERIESLFEKLDSAKELAQNALDSFENHKVAILNKAFTGELTTKWREENGVSFESWKEEKLCDLGKLERGRSKHRPRNAPELFGGEYPFIQTGDVANADAYIVEHKQTLSEFGLAQSRLFPKGTLCITIAANIGDVAILQYDCCFPDSVVGFTPNQYADSKYIYYYMSIIKKEIEATAPATAQKNINLKILNDITVKIPKIQEQKEIVKILDDILEKEKQVKEFSNVIEKVDLMKKAILARVFRGELGTNNPEEESAIELLKEVLKEKL